ncbi:MAG TPA: MBL fold metallo-hydrolase [Spirochaetota bacterium]|nr:MBL fold metallo-hydrolase [Spirochaetota bacterium]
MNGEYIMKIYNLTEKSTVYTSNVYLVTGTWNAMEDVNTLVDAGRDLAVLEMIFEIPTGVGKKQVEKVVLTHNHYDHTSMLRNVKAVFNPRVYAYSKSLDGVDRLLKDGETIKLGDRSFEVLHTPGHSSDSICLFCPEDGVLFSGDTPVIIRSANSTYEEEFIKAMERLCRRDVKSIYFGHGDPMFEGCNAALRKSLDNIRSGMGLSVGQYR